MPGGSGIPDEDEIFRKLMNEQGNNTIVVHIKVAGHTYKVGLDFNKYLKAQEEREKWLGYLYGECTARINNHLKENKDETHPNRS